MGIRIRGRRRDVGARLDKYGDRSTRALRRVHRDAAEKLAEVAGQMAPYDSREDGKGHLEDSFVVETVRTTRNRVSYVVRSVGLKYAIWTHEAQYNLGPDSIAKSAGSPFVVGRKYLSRAVDYITGEWGLGARARQALRRK